MKEVTNNQTEKYSHWEVPKQENVISETHNPKLERIKQSSSSRLCEYITGMRPEDPTMIERLQEDQKIIRAKYNLPNPNLSTSEFERALKQIAQDQKIEIRSKHEYSRLFDEVSDAGAVTLDDRKVVVDIDRSSQKSHNKSLKQMEHELVHAMQLKYAASMPIELMEYEAYVSNGNMELLKDNPEAINDILFGTLIKGSVDIYYDLESKRRGEQMSPVWDNPDYFIHKDEQAKILEKQNRLEQDQKRIQDIRSQLGIPNPE